MNINLIRLAGVERQLERLNRNLELLLVHAYNIQPHTEKRKKAEEEGEPAGVAYTDEEEQAIDEILARLGRQAVSEKEA